MNYYLSALYTTAARGYRNLNSGWITKVQAVYLRTQAIDLCSSHAHQLHPLLVVGDGTGEVGHLKNEGESDVKGSFVH